MTCVRGHVTSVQVSCDPYVWFIACVYPSCCVHSLTLISFQTVKTEGPMALYKGIVPSYLRLGPWNIIVSLNS